MHLEERSMVPGRLEPKLSHTNQNAWLSGEELLHLCKATKKHSCSSQKYLGTSEGCRGLDCLGKLLKSILWLLTRVHISPLCHMGVDTHPCNGRARPLGLARGASGCCCGGVGCSVRWGPWPLS